MKAFHKNRIDNLSDVFCAWMGGTPENDQEVKDFLRQNEKLARLVNYRDVEKIVHYNAGFPPEVIRAIYAIIPVTVKLANGKEFTILEGHFKKMNSAEISRLNGRVISIDMSRAYKIYITDYADKALYMRKNYRKFRARNERILFPNRSKLSYLRRRDAMNEQQREEVREKNREYKRKWRAEHPDKVAEKAERRKERRKNRKEIDIISERIASRINNRKYRENNREKIRQRNNAARQRLKLENPELLKDLDKKNNSRPNRKKVCRDYYYKHKEEIKLRSQNNPNIKEYKKKYMVKRRWQEKTGPVVMDLLQALVLHKQRDR